jgi:hypothetical protein
MLNTADRIWTGIIVHLIIGQGISRGYGSGNFELTTSSLFGTPFTLAVYILQI